MPSPSQSQAFLESVKKRLLLFLLLIGCGSTFYGLLVRLSLAPSPQQLPAVLLCLFSCPIEQGHHTKIINLPTQSEVPYLNSSQPLQELLGEVFDTAKVSLLVEKSRYQLTVFYEDDPVKTYPMVLGSSPTGDKLAEGDRKTPEGIYHVRDLYEHPDWSKFIWLDYPTPQDWQEHHQAKLAGDIPPHATIGSEIGIHGVPSGADSLIDQKNNWTWGCIALKNKDVDEIYQVITQGTLIEIVP